MVLKEVDVKFSDMFFAAFFEISYEVANFTALEKDRSGNVKNFTCKSS